jgi:hypothetical protein
MNSFSVRAGCLALGAVACASPAAAGAPVAIVEDVGGIVLGVEPMDYLDAGQKITLGDGAFMVVSYFSSCAHEKITGGEVVVQDGHSVVTGGAVVRTTAKCDGEKLQLSQGQGEQTAGVVVRGITASDFAFGKNVLTIYGASPTLVAPAGDSITIERLDPKQKPEVLHAHRVGGRLVYDYAQEGRALAPGGVYRATSGDRKALFRIDPAAEPGETPLVGRLVLISAQ